MKRKQKRPPSDEDETIGFTFKRPPSEVMLLAIGKERPRQKDISADMRKVLGALLLEYMRANAKSHETEALRQVLAERWPGAFTEPIAVKYNS